MDNQLGHITLKSIPNWPIVHLKITMNKSMAHPNNIPPWDVGIRFLKSR
jgi:hypothetical protein